MSPHAVPLECPEDRDSLSAELRKFAVTKNAFLPDESPLARLPDPYYEPWERIAQSLPALIHGRQIHASVRNLPVLSTDRLSSQPEWRRAYLLLSYITHAHIWGGDKPNDITLPLLAVSAHLELPPTLTYAAVCLWNFSSTTASFSDLGSLRTLVSFTGTESEAWFSLISVAMEARASSILATMLAALDAVKARAYGTITAALLELARCIDSVSRLLERMYERCEPMVFYHQIRPFLAGTKNMQGAGLPRGVFYDHGGGQGEWRQLRGGSNGQSSLIQFFDVVLGVDHKGHGDESRINESNSNSNSNKDHDNDGNHPPDSFHAQVREYMPGPHRRFLVHVMRMGSIRELALVPPTTDDQRRLRDAYQRATDALCQFRNKHIQIVTRYIILPSRQQPPPREGPAGSGDPAGRRQNLASSSLARKGEELTGTGGTMLVPFLRQARDETIAAGKLDR
ncbi:Indoleamine 2 [Escovopsis weberi]|uniref:Indoleamine 2 n=1 Tax=Escovopsis weberi TaxID=150374 RepID=A0A0M8MVA0_ESCWE|nr:Indoleamine 2 [Escovopsis weberi]